MGKNILVELHLAVPQLGEHLAVHIGVKLRRGIQYREASGKLLRAAEVCNAQADAPVQFHQRGDVM